jgi:hypothetical protein
MQITLTEAAKLVHNTLMVEILTAPTRLTTTLTQVRLVLITVMVQILTAPTRLIIMDLPKATQLMDTGSTPATQLILIVSGMEVGTLTAVQAQRGTLDMSRVK